MSADEMPAEPDAGEVEALAGIAGHTTFAYGQGSYDGDACRACSWQGPPRSGVGHEGETKRRALSDWLAACDARVRREGEADGLRAASAALYDEWPGGHAYESLGIQWAEDWLSDRADRITP